MEDFKENCRQLGEKCFEGEVTLPKTELWLVLTACFLAGILYGLRKAPLTHGVGVVIGSGNGNSFHCGIGGRRKASDGKAGQEEDEAPKEQECVKGRKKCRRK